MKQNETEHYNTLAISLRHDLKMTQAEFWSILGITQSGGSRFESGKRPIPMPVWLLLRLIKRNGMKWFQTITTQ